MSDSPDGQERELAARRVLWIFAALAAVAVVVVFVVFRPGTLGIEVPDAAPSPVEPLPQGGESAPSATATPGEAAPGNWELPARQWEAFSTPSVMEPPMAALAGNVFYGFDVVAPEGCPSPATVADEQAWQDAVSAHWSCLHQTFGPIFEQMGVRTDEAEVHFFVGSGADSACGRIEAPAFYCSANNGSVHFGGEHLEMAREWELAVAEMVSHEYGHHIQNVTGMTEAKLQLPEATAAERRAELQAICWSGALTLRTGSIDFGEKEFTGWEDRVGAMVASDVHGSRESLDYWGMRGLWAASFGDCNTWLAPAHRVS